MSRARDLGERAFRRQKRRDAALAVPVAGTVLLCSPLLGVFGGTLWGVPVSVIYVFGVWAGLILLTRTLARRLARDDMG